MKKQLYLSALVIVVLLSACANQSIATKKTARITKLTVEEAYDVIYTAYLRGYIPVEVKDKAAGIRDRYTTVQSGIVRAITANDLDEADQLLSVAGVLTTEILDIVIQHKLEERLNDDSG